MRPQSSSVQLITCFMLTMLLVEANHLGCFYSTIINIRPELNLLGAAENVSLLRGIVFTAPIHEGIAFTRMLLITVGWLIIQVDVLPIIEDHIVKLPLHENGTVKAHPIEHYWPQALVQAIQSLDGQDNKITIIYQHNTRIYFQTIENKAIEYDLLTQSVKEGKGQVVLPSFPINRNRLGVSHSFYTVEQNNASNITQTLLVPYLGKPSGFQRNRDKDSEPSNIKRISTCCASNDWGFINLESSSSIASMQMKPVTHWNLGLGFHVAHRFFILESDRVLHFSSVFKSSARGVNYLYQPLYELKWTQFFQCSKTSLSNDRPGANESSNTPNNISPDWERVCMGLVMLELFVLALAIVYFLRRSWHITEAYRKLFVQHITKEHHPAGRRRSS